MFVNTKILSAFLCVSFSLPSVLCATPFVPLAWQTKVRMGGAVGQKKHVGWIRDQNGDFIDDAFEELGGGDRTQVIIQLNDCRSPQALRTRFARYGKVVRTGVLVAYVFLDNVIARELPKLAGDPWVAALERPANVEWGLNASTRSIRARESKTYSPKTFADMPGAADGSNIVIAVVDSGVDDQTHTALSGKFIGGVDATVNPPDDSHNPSDAHGHGTHVAGIAMGLGVGNAAGPLGGRGRILSDGTPLTSQDGAGVAPGAKLLDIKVGKGGGTQTGIGSLHEGLKWVFLDGRAHVVNISQWDAKNSMGQEVTPQLINGLVAHGLHVVVISGNAGEQKLGPTAAAGLAITVGNVDDQSSPDRDDDEIHSSSNFGPRGDFDLKGLTVGMLKPDIVAPGTDIRSAERGTARDYESATGTSAAAPHVAGAIALLLSMPGKSDVPPGSMKELLKHSAYLPAKAKPSYPTIPFYHAKWGYGILDVYEAAQALQNGITDVAFTACVGPHPSAKPCRISNGRPFYANDTDIQLDRDPPRQNEPNTIRVKVQNKGTNVASDVVVCVGVKELGVGLKRFYELGCRTIPILGATDVKTLEFPWKPAASDHQCIQATIDYGFDTNFRNNLTQRNVKPIATSSPAKASFRVENPLNEIATVLLEVRADRASRRNFSVELRNDRFELAPEDCAQINEIEFFSNFDLPTGTTATFDVAGRAVTASNPDGIELSGVVFKLVVSDAALERAYSCAHHGAAGEIELPLKLAEGSTSDPRRDVARVKAIFNVQVRPRTGLSLEEAIHIRRASGAQPPRITASFAGQRAYGTELIIEFQTRPLGPDQYSFYFGDGLVDLDGDRLRGAATFDLTTLPGDATGDHKVDKADVAFVRRWIDRTVDFGNRVRADVNQDGAITHADVKFIQAIDY